LKLNFYYRENCHLCDAMRKAMVVFNRRLQPITWQEIDIDRDIDLIRQYDVLVPVLCFGEQEICHHFFDEKALLVALKKG
jgi:thioredoxin reductase (NADPH)